MGTRPCLLVTVALLFGVGGTAPARPHAPAPGVIEGLVKTPQSPPRKAPQRYPGARADSHEVQPLSAIVYIVGPVAGATWSESPPPTMTQHDTTFVPSVVVVRVGGTVAFPNGDPFFHNVFSYSSAKRFDLGRYPKGESKSVTFPEAGIVEVFCEVHEFMRGAILVAENPYYAIVGADGSFRIPGVPPGTYTIAFWHPDHHPLQQEVEVTDGGTSWVSVELTR